MPRSRQASVNFESLNGDITLKRPLFGPSVLYTGFHSTLLKTGPYQFFGKVIAILAHAGILLYFASASFFNNN